MRNFIEDCLRTESTRFCNLEDGEGKDYNKELIATLRSWFGIVNNKRK